MVSAERVKVCGKEWVKVKIPPLPIIVEAIKKVKGSLYNPATKFWAIPYENRNDFENKMADFLIVWTGGEETKYPGGIKEDDIPMYPTTPGYSVSYNEEGSIIDSKGFKTRPYGEYQVRGVNLITDRNFLILGDDMGLGNVFLLNC